MTASHIRISALFISLFSMLLFASCASIPELKVHYQLSKASDRLGGKRIVLAFEDARPQRTFIGQGAQADFKNFSGKFSFSFARYKESGFKIGLFDLPELFKEVFRKRLENEGLQVVAAPAPSPAGTPELRIVLKDLQLDLDRRRWTATMRYDALLVLDGREVATQSLSGQTERAKVVGTSGADAVMGELFTDMANRLDVVGLVGKTQERGS